MKFMKGPEIVDAYFNTRERRIKTVGGSVLVLGGDWIIVGAGGNRYPCKPDDFFKDYKPLDDEAKAAWEDVYGGLV